MGWMAGQRDPTYFVGPPPPVMGDNKKVVVILQTKPYLHMLKYMAVTTVESFLL